MLRKTRGEKTFITTKLKSSHQAWSNGQFKVSYSQTTGVKERKWDIPSVWSRLTSEPGLICSEVCDVITAVLLSLNSWWCGTARVLFVNMLAEVMLPPASSLSRKPGVAHSWWSSLWRFSRWRRIELRWRTDILQYGHTNICPPWNFLMWPFNMCSCNMNTYTRFYFTGPMLLIIHTKHSRKLSNLCPQAVNLKCVHTEEFQI